jgi:hypothetical protein
MFLVNLTEDEKRAFMCLAEKVAWADNDLADSEKAMIDGIRISINLPANAEKMGEDESVKVLSASDVAKKRGFYIELLSLVRADTVSDPREMACLDSLAKAIGLDGAFTGRAADWLTRYMAVSVEGWQLVNG